MRMMTLSPGPFVQMKCDHAAQVPGAEQVWTAVAPVPARPPRVSHTLAFTESPHPRAACCRGGWQNRQ